MPEPSYAIETVDLTKIYRLGSIEVVALRNVTLKVNYGEFLALVGPSGSGKSTLLNIIGALDKPTEGRVLIDGVDIVTLNENELSRLRNEKVGFVFQAYNLINRTSVLRNVELPAMVTGVPHRKRLAKAYELLSAMGIADKAGRKPTALSGGEQQRVAIARALINNPTFILADEPTGNIDSKTGREIFELLRKMNREIGTTIIVVTHNLEFAQSTDRVVYLKDGTIEREEYLGRK